MGDGFTGGIYVFVWQVALFRSLSENFMAFGGALAIAAVVGAVGGLYLGRYIDSGGRRAVYIACGSLGLVLLMRAAATHDPALAVFANAMSALGGCLYIPTVMTVVYTLGKRAPCTLRFHVATEAGWDLGGATGLVAGGGSLLGGRAGLGGSPARASGRDLAVRPPARALRPAAGRIRGTGGIEGRVPWGPKGDHTTARVNLF